MKLQDYLHLYLGCEGEFTPPDGIAYYRPEKLTPDILGRVLYDGYAFKPLLRPLSDMTEEERESLFPHWSDLYAPDYTDEEFSPEEVRIMLSRHFDLFGLIDAGLALDKTKQPTK